MTLSSELLPAPFGPIKAQISPPATSKEIWVSALMPLKDSDTSRIDSRVPLMRLRPQQRANVLVALQREQRWVPGKPDVQRDSSLHLTGGTAPALSPAQSQGEHRFP